MPIKVVVVVYWRTSGRTTFRTQPKSPKNPEQPLEPGRESLREYKKWITRGGERTVLEKKSKSGWMRSSKIIGLENGERAVVSAGNGQHLQKLWFRGRSERTGPWKWWDVQLINAVTGRESGGSSKNRIGSKDGQRNGYWGNRIFEMQS